MNRIAEAAIAVAKAEIDAGAREIGGNNRGPFVAKYLAPAGLTPPQPWCAAFVSWCLRRAGAAVPYFTSARSFFNWCRSKGLLRDKPERGCLVFWARGAPASWLGHVGMVTAVKPNVIETIEGNHTARVERFRYLPGDLDRLLGFASFGG